MRKAWPCISILSEWPIIGAQWITQSTRTDARPSRRLRAVRWTDNIFSWKRPGAALPGKRRSVRRWAPPHRTVLPTGGKSTDKMVGHVGQRKWQLVTCDPALQPNSFSYSSDIGLIATTGALLPNGLCETICSTDTCVSTDEAGRVKSRLVPRIVVTQWDTLVHGDVMPKV